MAYVMNYMIHDLADQCEIQICGKLGNDTLQHLSDLKQEEIMETVQNKRWAQSINNMREYFLYAGYLHSDMNKVRDKIIELKGDNTPEK